MRIGEIVKDEHGNYAIVSTISADFSAPGLSYIKITYASPECVAKFRTVVRYPYDTDQLISCGTCINRTQLKRLSEGLGTINPTKESEHLREWNRRVEDFVFRNTPGSLF